MSQKEDNENKQPTQQVLALEDLLKIEFTIPPYQRPYKWKENHVVDLLEDIFDYVIAKGQVYRIGSVIIHEEAGKDENSQEDKILNNIVDGQQRLVTLSMLFKILDKDFNELLIKHDFKNPISRQNIEHNGYVIKTWIDNKFDSEDKRLNIKEKILKKCEVVLFTVYNADEAFQLFDSQNARGKDLEPYDLLKAFHLREMLEEHQDDIAYCASRWEASIDNGTLKPILANHLFRIRKWCRGEGSYYFTKNQIDEFKGISLYQNYKYPYESPTRILDGSVRNAQNNGLLRNFHVAQIYPFQINMPIINGKRFFEYVHYYIELRSRLFDEKEETKETANFNKFYKDGCNYPHSQRSGDQKVRNYYENILLLFVDKFGLVEEFDNYYMAFYKHAYHLRLDKKRISVQTIINDLNETKTFQDINQLMLHTDLKNYLYKTYNLNRREEMVKGVDRIVNIIKK